MNESLESFIAVIDDDASLRRALANLLGSVGFSTRTFASAEQFLTAVASDVACVVLDLRLPGMSGLELVHALRTDWPGLPVLVLSAHSDTFTRQRCLAAGVVAVLAKPFIPDELVTTLRSVTRTA
jgi:FixJ family two-component response regulator